MELRRQRGIATFVTWPFKDASGTMITGITGISPQYATWTDGTAPNTKFSTISGGVVEIDAAGRYYSSLTATEMANDYIYFFASPTSGTARPIDLLINCTAVASVTNVSSVTNTVPANLVTWIGVVPNVLTGGRVDSYAAVLNWASVTAPSTAVNLTSTQIASVNYPVALNWASISGMSAFATLTGTTVASVSNAVFPNWGQVQNATAVVGLTNTTVATATHIEDLTSTTYPEPSAVPAATATLKNKLNFLQLLARNQVTISSVTQVVWDDAGTATVSFATHTDAAGLFTKNEWS